MSSTPRVLFVTRPYIAIRSGGLARKIRRLERELRARGIEVCLYDPWTNAIPHVDACHIFGDAGTLCYFAQEAASQGRKVFVSPVLGGFDVPFWLFRLKTTLSGRVPGLYSDYVLLRRMLRMTTKVLPLHEAEADRVARGFGVPREKIEIVPNGVDHEFASGDPGWCRRTYNNGRFVLQVGTIDANKNQLASVRAAKASGVPLLVVGQPYLGTEAYFDRCTAEGGPVTFAGHLPADSPELRSCFAAASAFVLPSRSEVMPQVLYQAAAAGLPTLVSRTIPLPPRIEAHVTRVDADDVQELGRAFQAAVHRERATALQEVALSMPSWADVAAQLEAIYRA
ncbi:MAG: glycosyl transferase, group 1 [Acidobacteria bacterium]|nr:glycosyl transferase, group 1 [Acidobacteriota bacterium]